MPETTPDPSPTATDLESVLGLVHTLRRAIVRADDALEGVIKTLGGPIDETSLTRAAEGIIAAHEVLHAAAKGAAAQLPPVNPRAMPLTAPGEPTPSVWRCSCNRVHPSEDDALRCHGCSCHFCAEASATGAHPACRQADADKDRAAYLTRVELQEARRLLAAKQIAEANYEGFVFWEGHHGDALGGDDGYFTDVNAVRARCDHAELPVWVWSCSKHYATLSAADFLASALEQDEVPDGAQFSQAATEDLEKAIAAWNEIHGDDVVSWMQDDGRVVVLRPEAMAGVLTDARLLLARNEREAQPTPPEGHGACEVCGAAGEHLVRPARRWDTQEHVTVCSPCLLADAIPYARVVDLLTKFGGTDSDLSAHDGAWLDASLAAAGKTREDLWADVVARRAVLSPVETAPEAPAPIAKPAPVLRPLPATWAPGSSYCRKLEGLGADPKRATELYRLEMAGETRARWMDKAFFDWAKSLVAAKDPRVMATARTTKP